MKKQKRTLLISRNSYEDCMRIYSAVKRGTITESADFKKFLLEAEEEYTLEQMEEYINAHPNKAVYEKENVQYKGNVIKVKDLPIPEKFQYFTMEDSKRVSREEDIDIDVSDIITYGVYITDNTDSSSTKGGDIQGSITGENIVGDLIKQYVLNSSLQSFDKEGFGKELYDVMIKSGVKPSVFLQPGWKIVVGEFTTPTKFEPASGWELITDPTGKVFSLEVDSVSDGTIKFKDKIVKESLDIKKFLTEMFLIMNKYRRYKLPPVKRILIEEKKPDSGV